MLQPVLERVISKLYRCTVSLLVCLFTRRDTALRQGRTGHRSSNVPRHVVEAKTRSERSVRLVEADSSRTVPSRKRKLTESIQRSKTGGTSPGLSDADIKPLRL